MQIRATQGESSRANRAHIHFVHHQGGRKKGLCCQRYEMIFVLQINHSLRSGRPIVQALSSVGLAVVTRQLGMRLSWHGGVCSCTGRYAAAWRGSTHRKGGKRQRNAAIDLNLMAPHAEGCWSLEQPVVLSAAARRKLAYGVNNAHRAARRQWFHNYK